jgi:RNA polymerase sigma-70 factor (ECF subfamily)
VTTPRTDAELINASRQGDADAFGELVRRYQRAVANLIFLTLGDRNEVEDLTQEVFIRAYRSLGRFDEKSNFYSWLYRIAVNLCIDEIRRRKIRKLLSLDLMSEPLLEREKKAKEKDSAASANLMKEERKQMVLQALEKLSPLYRSALVLREYENMGYEEIAETLGISVQAVKSRIFRARQEMRNLLKDYFEEMS